MTALAIAAILLGMGVPGFRSLLQNHRLATTANELFAAIHLTRSEAVQRGTRVDLVPLDGHDWTSGWIVFVDLNEDRRPDPDDHTIFTHGAVPAGMRIETRFSDANGKYLAYSGNGRTRTNGNENAPQAGHFLLTMNDSSRRIVIGFLGRPRVCNPATEKSTC